MRWLYLAFLLVSLTLTIRSAPSSSQRNKQVKHITAIQPKEKSVAELINNTSILSSSPQGSPSSSSSWRPSQNDDVDKRGKRPAASSSSKKAVSKKAANFRSVQESYIPEASSAPQADGDSYNSSKIIGVHDCFAKPPPEFKAGNRYEYEPLPTAFTHTKQDWKSVIKNQWGSHGLTTKEWTLNDIPLSPTQEDPGSPRFDVESPSNSS